MIARRVDQLPADVANAMFTSDAGMWRYTVPMHSHATATRSLWRLLCMLDTQRYLTDDDVHYINSLMGTGNCSATSNNMKMVHWPLMGWLLHLVQRGGTGQGCSPPRPLLAVPNITAHPSTASVQWSVAVSV